MGDSKKVLIIDDEGDLLEMVTMRLNKAGHEVETALDGKQGLEKVSSFKPNVILLDVNMPELNGWQVCQALKENPETANISVVILTATRDLKQAKEVKADRVVLKPFNFDEILGVIDQS
ncbi:MAG: response regulator [Deltaproteobacteria bacterium]|nr:response regulator [Deltaproteobacteria bacterium]